MDGPHHRAARLEDLAEGVARPVTVAGQRIALCLTGGSVHAVLDRCTHADSPLSGGRVRRGSIICPDHGAIFNLTTGACVGSAGYRPLTVLPARIVDGWVELDLTACAPPQGPVA